MQRSRKAFLQRRALEKTPNGIGWNHFYKFSLFLVFILWGLFFLFSFWIRHGHGHGHGRKDGYNAPLLPDWISTWNESKFGSRVNSVLTDEPHLDRTDSVSPSKDYCIDNAISGAFDNEILAHKESVNHVAIVENIPSFLGLGELPDVEKDDLGGNSVSDSFKADRLTNALPLGLEVFKSRLFISKSKSGTGQAESIIHRLEPGGAEYNYAAASKGAKVLSFNKEAKGASNILGRDKDKYLRNPCSAEEKFVTLELSEEILVHAIKIANFEHHSSNLKEFKLLGSSVYPTDVWLKLGNFTATNAKHAQRFVLEEPKWARYLKLSLLSHHGSEFYCTLSDFEVYGVDAVEEMLEDLVSVHDSSFISAVLTADNEPMAKSNNERHNYDREVSVDTDIVREIAKRDMPDPSRELRHHQAGRMPGDTILKILMQKVRSSDLNLSILERYLEELNSKYGNILKEFDDDIIGKDILLEKIQADIRNLLKGQEATGTDLSDLVSWRSLISVQLDDLHRDNAILRSEIEKIRENQISLENRGTAVIFVCMLFLFLAFTSLFIDMLVSVYTGLSAQRTGKSRKFCMNNSWIFLLLSCSVIIFILS